MNAVATSPPRTDASRLLLIDDDAEQYRPHFSALHEYGFETFFELDPERALWAIREHRPDVILLDLRFPGDEAQTDSTGARLLREIRRDFPRIPVVVFTTTLTDERYPLENLGPDQRKYAKDQIRELIRLGEDWIADLARTLQLAIDDRPGPRVGADEELGFVVGTTQAMQEVASRIRSVAASNFTVLIEGETGTGKELAAHAIHRLSGRRGAFVPLNCSGVHAETLESTLFGHERGAFTGAASPRQGVFEAANGGTVFLDELQAIPNEFQNKLMRVLNDSLVMRMGGTSALMVDFRLIVATNRPAVELVKEGTLREDLRYRVDKFRIYLPPLRERLEDLPALWTAVVRKINKERSAAKQPALLGTLRRDVLEELRRHRWLGNIREFENVLIRAAVSTKGNVIEPVDIEVDPAPGPNAGIVTSDSARTAVSIAQPQPQGPEPTPAVASDAEILAKALRNMPKAKRYEHLRNNTGGDLRRQVLQEVIRQAREDQFKPMTSRQLTEFLCDFEPGDEKAARRANARVRQLLTSANIQLRDKEKRESEGGEPEEG